MREAQMRDSDVIAEALKDLHKNETLEEAMGRAVRKRGGKYEDYLRMMANIRDIAYSKGVTPLEAAKEIAGQP